MKAIDLSKQQALNADAKAIQQINFPGIIKRAEGATVFFIIEKAKQKKTKTKKTVLDFTQGTVRAS